jgi:hypothetical protein
VIIQQTEAGTHNAISARLNGTTDRIIQVMVGDEKDEINCIITAAAIAV